MRIYQENMLSYIFTILCESSASGRCRVGCVLILLVKIMNSTILELYPTLIFKYMYKYSWPVYSIECSVLCLFPTSSKLICWSLSATLSHCHRLLLEWHGHCHTATLPQVTFIVAWSLSHCHRLLLEWHGHCLTVTLPQVTFRVAVSHCHRLLLEWQCHFHPADSAGTQFKLPLEAN